MFNFNNPGRTFIVNVGDDGQVQYLEVYPKYARLEMNHYNSVTINLEAYVVGEAVWTRGPMPTGPAPRRLAQEPTVSEMRPRQLSRDL